LAKDNCEFQWAIFLIPRADGVLANDNQEKYATYIRGCQMAVKMIIDQWNPSRRRRGTSQRGLDE